MKRPCKYHSPEFKQEAVMLVMEHGYSCGAAGRSLGVSGALLRPTGSPRSEIFPGKGKRTTKQQGIYELETENWRLQMAQEIFKNQWPSLPRNAQEVSIY